MAVFLTKVFCSSTRDSNRASEGPSLVNAFEVPGLSFSQKIFSPGLPIVFLPSELHVLRIMVRNVGVYKLYPASFSQK